MRTLLAVIMTLATTITFAQSRAKTAATQNVKPAAMASTLDVTGDLKWTGYGVGKSHKGTIPVSGKVEMNGDTLVGGNFVLDMANLKTGDSPRLEGHLKSADFFEVEKYKDGNFKITKVEALPAGKSNEPTHKITGDLTIKGKTNTETLLATIVKKEKKHTATATTTVADRTKYDIVYRSGKFTPVATLGDKLIEDKIDIQLDVTTK